ncbi:MAG: MaoC family dehydratase N-terminal domain-containing protein [Novosphingobium sp.]|jgi:3-methylfumaryl-CoA hydratase|nr:MaoC family dehydratase N-terminal domain-containing protein [Novosphingobium sp.]
MSEDFSAWVGKSEELVDVLEPGRSNALRAALGETEALAAGAELPLLHHWLYFWNVQPPAGLGVDGHPAKGGFLPPVSLPRRMWAGGRLTFHAPLLLGESVTRTSTILKVEAKSGKSGNLVFVTVEHRLAGAQGLAITEEQDIVYREPAAAGAIPGPADTGEVPAAAWRREIAPDPVLLFRYSALTMNGHRIHYDRPYAMNEEAYPALVVHGPLQATLLADLAVRNLGGKIATFDFRGMSPAFDGTRLHVCGDANETGASLWTQQGATRNMTATVTCD